MMCKYIRKLAVNVPEENYVLVLYPPICQDILLLRGNAHQFVRTKLQMTKQFQLM